jgi:hypothetical protein
VFWECQLLYKIYNTFLFFVHANYIYTHTYVYIVHQLKSPK